MSDDETLQTRIAILQNAGMAEAAGEPFDLAALASELALREQMLAIFVEQLEAAGLLLSGRDQHGRRCCSRRGGSSSTPAATCGGRCCTSFRASSMTSTRARRFVFAGVVLVVPRPARRRPARRRAGAAGVR